MTASTGRCSFNWLTFPSPLTGFSPRTPAASMKSTLPQTGSRFAASMKPPISTALRRRSRLERRRVERLIARRGGLHGIRLFDQEYDAPLVALGDLDLVAGLLDQSRDVDRR